MSVKYYICHKCTKMAGCLFREDDGEIKEYKDLAKNSADRFWKTYRENDFSCNKKEEIDVGDVMLEEL